MKNQGITVSKNRSHWAKIYIFAIILTALFLVTNASLIEVSAQTRIPSVGSEGNFSDIQVDGDRVKIFSTMEGGESGKIKIKLDADSNWWKMLRVIDKRGNYHNIEQENGGYVNRVEMIEINTSGLDNRFKLEFWKAKFLGVHTHMMTETYRKEDFAGRVVTFIWRDGLEGDGSDYSKDMTAPINETMTVNSKKLTIKSTENGTKEFATIKFQTDFDWWTAVKLFDRSGKAFVIEKNNGRYSPGTKTLKLPLNSLKSEIALEFWTAKFLGAHTNMATKKLLRERFDGRIVTITWGNAAAPINYDVKVDGSKVTIRSSDVGGTPGYATIKFVTNKSWWTALTVHDRNGAVYTTYKQDGKYNRKTQTIKIKISDLPSNVNLEFWTAKAFGVHTYMAGQKIANDRFDGRIVTVTWNK